jgi:hypothetical protein
MVSSSVYRDENEMSIILLQGPYCVSKRECEHRKSIKDVHNSISFTVGKF